ncbi:Mob1/phocein [Pilatotrama ljubarskyi]|nr:Mob1/phocein [Pilatotrama ljubarskyi]
MSAFFGIGKTRTFKPRKGVPEGTKQYQLRKYAEATLCPIMSAGPRYEYLWEDGVRYKKATKLPAPEYVDALMNWAQGLLDNEEIFPSEMGKPFPKNFRDTIGRLFRRLFRVYAHLYSNHFDHICALGIEAHLNTSYRHFFLFVNEFDLVDKRELAPLDELNEAILAEDKGR